MSRSYVLLPSAPQNKIQTQIKILLSDKAYIRKISKNAEPFLYYVYQQTISRHMPSEIALLPLVESDYYPFCLSSVGAEGLWQMMPGTAHDLKIPINWWYEGRRDLVSATQGALNHLTYLHHKYKDWLLALAAYDAGEVAVDAAIRHNRIHHLSTSFWNLKLSKETEDYVPRLLALAKIFQNPDQYHVNVAYVPNYPLIAIIPLNNQVNIQKLAKQIHVDSMMLLGLNPQYRRWVTPPGKGFTLVVPRNKASKALSEINSFTASNLWQNYQIKSGDTLNKIAVHFHVSVDTLSYLNHLNTHRIKIGQKLIVPFDYSDSAVRNKKSYQFIFATHDRSLNIGHFPQVHIAVNQMPEQAKLPPSYQASKSLFAFLSTVAEDIYHRYITSTSFGSNLAYEVKSGDSLSTIADHFHVTVAELKKANHLSSNTIGVGKVLNIPVEV